MKWSARGRADGSMKQAFTSSFQWYSHCYGKFLEGRFMLIAHCNEEFEARDIWFLQSLNSKEPNKMFNNRRLLIGKCPICQREVVVLIENRVFDNQEFIQTEVGYKAEKIMQNERKRITYTQNNCPKGRLTGHVFGINTEQHNKNGEVTSILQRSCDWNGRTAKVKRIKV